MQPDEPLIEAARAIYGVCFSAAPIDFDEARRRDAVMYRRALAAARQAKVEIDRCAA